MSQSPVCKLIQQAVKMRVAVVGAGAAGLCAARHLTSHDNFSCVVFEQTDSVGGTWVYTENTGLDKYGLPICSAIYKNLRTNLPKENMEFSDFPFLNPKSFVTASEVLQYLEDYSNHFNLKQHIKFHCHVTCISPKNEMWEVSYKDLLTETEEAEEFDSVIICNGHHSEPYLGDFPSTEEFEGQVIHSHVYRTPEPFTNKTVLVCGGGPSGIDISFDLANFASKVLFSHNCDLDMSHFPNNVSKVPIVREVKKDCVIYEDDTVSGQIDVILVCTGYKYSFPFLTPESGITVMEDKFVYPLYKHIINSNNPTMGFIGLLFRTFLYRLFDLQVQFFLKSLTGEMKLPSKEEMIKDTSKEILKNQTIGIPLRKYHQLGYKMRAYINVLTETANLEEIPAVTYKIYDQTLDLRGLHLFNYRDAVFEVIDENNFKMSGLLLDQSCK